MLGRACVRTVLIIFLGATRGFHSRICPLQLQDNICRGCKYALDAGEASYNIV